jgi:acetylornithine deacetylase/succinyl-diaminopimelate desuccinylase-like protein
MKDEISKPGTGSSGRKTRRTIRFIMGPASLASCQILFALVASGQIAPINPPPGWMQVPKGTGACTVGKSCAEVAPGMIQSALGASPLETNLRFLTDSNGGRVTGSPEVHRAIGWAVEALRHAGVDEAHTEKFTVPPTGGKLPVESENVVGEIRGREQPDEFVLLGAHLDPEATGDAALDDECNTAMVIDAARVIRTSGNIPRRSIRFVLFSDAKEGMPGPEAYVRAHQAELDRMVAAIAFDRCAGPVTGYSLGGRKDIVAAVREVLAPIQSLGVTEFTFDAKAGRDNLDFLLEGVPTLMANQSRAGAAQNPGTALNAFDKINIAELKRHVAIAAVTAYAIADAERRIGPRQSRAEIEQLIKDTGLGDEMKLEGIWPAWESGERGHQP